MNLINEKVTHKRFGTGSIVNHNDSSIEIHFASENKKFVFPDVFGKHLTLHDKRIANSLEKIIQKKEMERKEEEWKKEEEKKLQQKNLELRLEHEKLMKNHKLHPESQMVYWCDTEEQNSSLSEWKVFSGLIKSGNNKGKPNKPIRLHQNSAVLLTAIDPSMPEKDRRILGVYMVNENFVGKLCEDGYIPAHSKYKLQLTEQESDQMLFWKYYVNKKFPHKMTWNTGKYRYFDNSWMAQILLDIVSLKSDPKERELGQQFFEHFCKMNQITDQELPKPNGALMRI
ncbi:malate synthase [Bacillus sp. DTU_2020_1000418_1_SI_GHA_SEK_038]|uniref:malate synthase n=1 Tax=Bacillus sp. DTU_2020_1000418_1_SI_GHA_SEK_038 TaxID=3077585 RepID=UPI0028F102E9|nr:malate synthase [Bacillus sp. DTU_2020_1000418_1_SI_GHA_SEK_038]WNS76049.1 malate synthase [Bacillus sp. DTU_2020_1000418_1_SI_GHA_SEK_038]